MTVFTSFELENINTFKKVKFDLNKYPLAVIRGKNLDDKDKANPSSNEVGKSLLFSTGLISPLYNTLQTSLNNKKDAKTIFGKDSKLRLNFEDGKHKYAVEQQLKGPSLGIKVFKDGKDKELHKLADALTYLRKVYPINEDAFNNLVYINARDPQILQKGKPGDIFDFFEKLFNYSIYDTVYKAICKQHDDVKFAAQILSGLENDRKALVSNFEFNPNLPTKLATLTDNISKVQKRLAKYHKELQHIRVYKLITEQLQYETYTDVDKLDSKLAILNKQLFDLEGSYHKYKKHLEDWRNQKILAADIAEKQEKLEKHRANQAENKYASKYSTKEIEQRLAKLRLEIDDYDSIETKIIALKNTIKLINVTLIRLDLSLEEKNKLKGIDSDSITKKLALQSKAYDDLEYEIETYQDILKSAKHGKCPTCRQKIDAKRISDIIRTKRGTLVELDKRKAKYKLQEEFCFAVEQLDKSIAELTKLNEQSAKYDALVKREYLMQQALVRDRVIKKIANEIAVLEPLRSKVKKPVEINKAEIEKLKTRIKRLEAHKTALHQYDKLAVKYDSVIAANKRFKQLNEFIDEYQPQLEDVQQRYHRLSTRVVEQNTTKERLAELDKQIEDQRKKTKDYKILVALKEAYSAKGLRIIKIRHIAEQYCANLNKYSSLIFPEQMKFSVQVDKNVFAINVTRSSGITSNVRRMSGMQTGAFIILSLLSLLPLLPANMRSNLLVLDELELGMSAGIRRRLAEDFIPKLRKIIPNIVIITPMSKEEFFIPNATEFIVTKQDNVSIIKAA